MCHFCSTCNNKSINPAIMFELVSERTRTYIISTTDCIIVKLTGCNARRSCAVVWNGQLMYLTDSSRNIKTQLGLLRGSTVLLFNS